MNPELIICISFNGFLLVYLAALFCYIRCFRKKQINEAKGNESTMTSTLKSNSQTTNPSGNSSFLNIHNRSSMERISNAIKSQIDNNLISNIVVGNSN